jgi:hypothetical protein
VNDLLLALRQSPVWTGLRPNCRHIALTLAIHVMPGDPMSTRMGIEGLARHTGLHMVEVQVRLRELQRVGLIKRSKPLRGAALVTTFTLDLPDHSYVRAPELADVDGARS